MALSPERSTLSRVLLPKVPGDGCVGRGHYENIDGKEERGYVARSINLTSAPLALTRGSHHTRRNEKSARIVLLIHDLLTVDQSKPVGIQRSESHVRPHVAVYEVGCHVQRNKNHQESVCQ